jgi:hypothetical protein
LAALIWTTVSCSPNNSHPSNTNLNDRPESSLAILGDDEIPLVSLDGTNHVTETKVSESAFIAQTFNSALTINDSLLPVLDKAEESNKPSDWNLRAFEVGIGVAGEIGVGPVGVGFMPKMKFIFTNHSNPLPPPLFL